MENAVNSIWNNLHQKIKIFILSKVNDEDTANDILQEVFIKVYLNHHQVKDGTKLVSWVYQIARNTVTDYYRKLKPQSDIELVEIAEESSIENYNEAFKEDVIPFINQLPPKYKEALLLTEFKGYSQLELAKHLGISYSGAKSRVQRAKEMLKELFNQCCKICYDNYGNIIDYQARKNV